MRTRKVILLIVFVIFICGSILGTGFIINKNNYKLRVMEKYDLTQTGYEKLKDILGKALEEIDKQNMINVDLYYAKESSFVLIRGEKADENSEKMVGVNLFKNYKYIEITSENEITINNYNDTLDLLGIAGEYYNKCFDNARQDINYNDFIYFKNISEAKDIL